MEHANKSLVAVQGADSLRVDVSDVLKYPFTFSSINAIYVSLYYQIVL